MFACTWLPQRGHHVSMNNMMGMPCIFIDSKGYVVCLAGGEEDESDADELEEEAIDRYAPSQAGRHVAGLQHTSSRNTLSNDSGTTLDSDDWHKTRSLFNVTWPDTGDTQPARPPPASSTRSTQSQQSYHAGSDKNV